MTFASCQIDAIDVTAPHTAACGLPFHRRGRHLKDMILGLALSLFAAVVVYADEIQGWVPEAIILPDDAEVVMNREIGSSIRMFSFSTHADVRTLFRDWSAALEESQYSVRPQQSEFDEAAIEFSGEDILNAKIAAGVINGDEPVVITFDATLK